MTFLSGALIASVMTLGTGKSRKFPSHKYVIPEPLGHKAQQMT